MLGVTGSRKRREERTPIYGVQVYEFTLLFGVIVVVTE